MQALMKKWRVANMDQGINGGFSWDVLTKNSARLLSSYREVASRACVPAHKGLYVEFNSIDFNGHE